MTREFTSYEKSFRREATAKGKAEGERRADNMRTEKKSRHAFAEKAAAFFGRLADAKRTVSERFVTATQVLADKTAREGLFGEDRGKGYCGTDVDYIED